GGHPGIRSASPSNVGPGIRAAPQHRGPACREGIDCRDAETRTDRYYEPGWRMANPSAVARVDAARHGAAGDLRDGGQGEGRVSTSATPLTVVARNAENACAGAALLAMLLLPLAEIVTRRFLQGGVPGSTTIVQHLTLWVGFLGAALAARDGKLLALATATFLPDGRGRRFVDIFRAAVTSAVVGLLIWGALDLVASEKEAATRIASFLPAWIAQAVLPISLVAKAIFIVWQSNEEAVGRMAAGGGLLVAALLWRYPTMLSGLSVWPGLVVLFVEGFGA